MSQLALKAASSVTGNFTARVSSVSVLIQTLRVSRLCDRCGRFFSKHSKYEFHIGHVIPQILARQPFVSLMLICLEAKKFRER